VVSLPGELALPDLVFFDWRGVAVGASRPAAGVDTQAKKEQRLFCALCRHPVTHQDERIPVSGRHEHTCTNPGGHTFGIGCFHESVSCVAIGEATEAHTWFRGYAWRIAICASCEHHLGWRFEAPADHFHGLILDRLTSVAGASG
jgi:hypothetical protein